MAKCKNCTNLYNMSNENDEIVGKWCPKTNDSPDVESERECRHYKCMTQADRIRAMSDEELAEFMANKGGYIACNQCDFFNHDEEKCESPSGWLCTKGYAEALIHEWLQSEVEEQHGRQMDI